MRTLLVWVALISVGSARGAESPEECARKLLGSDNYTVTWGTPGGFPGDAELEIGDGNGHGGKLGWLRFRPGKDGVDVLRIEFDEGWHPYESKWPPDRAPVRVDHSRLDTVAYATLLRQLAVLNAASLKPVQRNGFSSSSNNFWVNARLTRAGQSLLEMDWAGYEGSSSEPKFAKPFAAVRLAREAVEGLELKNHTLTADERTWATEKFARDWKKFAVLEMHWWVRERYIQMIGVVGAQSALPILKTVLTADLPPKARGSSSDWRCIYLAINAVARLTRKDVREKPVEQMDVLKERKKALELIEAEK